MTAYEIINKGFGLAGESLEEFPDKNLPVIWLNITLAESMAAENSIRRTNGKELMVQSAVLKSLTDTVDMDDAICNIALPYGVASYLAGDRENNYMSAIYRNRFITALQNRAGGDEFTIQDMYGGVL